MRTYLRRLVVDNQSFLWYRGHLHIENKCIERLRVFLASDKKGFLEISFRAGNGVSVGYPEAGVIFWYDQEITYNLNRPAIIAALIRYALQNGWRTHDSKSGSNSPLVWDNGIELLSLAKAPSDLSEPDPNLGRFWVPRDSKNNCDNSPRINAGASLRSSLNAVLPYSDSQNV